jgi:hypothetical protein
MEARAGAAVLLAGRRRPAAAKAPVAAASATDLLRLSTQYYTVHPQPHSFKPRLPSHSVTALLMCLMIDLIC